MKIISLLFLLFISSKSFCQSPATYYFDEIMNLVPESKAVIKGTGKTENGLFKITAYYKKNHLASIVNYTDSSLQQREGLYQYYYKSGKLETQGIYRNGKRDGIWIGKEEDGRINDSLLFRDGKVSSDLRTFYYSGKTGKLVSYEDVANNKLYTAEFDRKGGLVSFDSTAEDYSDLYFITDTTAEFILGSGNWMKYIQKTIMPHLDEFNSNDYGTLLIRFVIDANGDVQDVEPLNKKNSVLARIMVPAIANAAKWKPAIQDDRKVKSLKVQPVTIQNH